MGSKKHKMVYIKGGGIALVDTNTKEQDSGPWLTARLKTWPSWP